MTIKEEILGRFIYLFLKHLSIELSDLIIIKKTSQLPKKSILRKSYNKNHSLNQNNSLRKVSFTYVDSIEFDPKTPCKFLNQPQREQFYLSKTDQQMQCLCHHDSRLNLKNKCKVKLKRQQK